MSQCQVSQLSVPGRGIPGSHSSTRAVGNNYLLTKVTGNNINKTTNPKLNVKVLLARSPKCSHSLQHQLTQGEVGMEGDGGINRMRLNYLTLENFKKHMTI